MLALRPESASVQPKAGAVNYLDTLGYPPYEQSTSDRLELPRPTWACAPDAHSLRRSEHPSSRSKQRTDACSGPPYAKGFPEQPPLCAGDSTTSETNKRRELTNNPYPTYQLSALSRLEPRGRGPAWLSALALIQTLHLSLSEPQMCYGASLGSHACSVIQRHALPQLRP